MVTDFLLASQFIIWIGLILIICALYALSRQVAVLSKRVPSVGALAVNNRIVSQAEAPGFEKVSIEGNIVAVGGTRGRDQLLFFLDIGCPICRSLVQTVKKVAHEESADLVFVSDGESVGQHLEFCRKSNLMPCDYLISEEVGQAYGVGKVPYAALIGPNGNIITFGIVNSREHLESLFQAREDGVDSLQEYFRKQ